MVNEFICINGDPVCSLHDHYQTPCRNTNLMHDQEEYNKTMSEVQIMADWLFGKISPYFRFLSFKPQVKIGISAVGKDLLFLRFRLKHSNVFIWK